MSSAFDQRRLPSSSVDRRRLQFTFNGETMDALEGDTVASALFAVGRRATRISQLRGEPRGIFCNMGVCFECLVEINGCPNQRACRTPVVNGMTVVTQVGPGTWGHEVGAVS